MTIRILCLSLLVSIAGWSQKILFPPDKTITASNRLQLTLGIEADDTVLSVDVFQADQRIYHDLLKKLKKGAKDITVPLAADADSNIRITNLADSKRAEITVTQKGGESDDRGNWEASGYVGASIDSFAANELRDYLGYNNNTNDKSAALQKASGPQTGYVAGVDFGYRFFKKSGSQRWPVQLWVYGETVHGQRSSEVDCNASPATCKLADPTGFDATKLGSTFFAILRNSSSLEGYVGARLEFLKLNPGAANSANLYLKSQLGFLTIQSNGGDVVDDHLKIGVGAIMTNGIFKHSYLEMGYGKSDLFVTRRGRRFKVDGYLEWQLPGDNLFSRAVSPFLQLTADSDFGKGSDSVRVYYGLNFDIRELFHKASEAESSVAGDKPKK